MSAFKEYLHAASKGWENPVNAFQGNMNRLLNSVGLLPEDEQQEADRRYKICKVCPFHSDNAKSIGFYDSSRIEEHCSLCKCPIESKVLAFNDTCGLNILEQKNDDNGNLVSGIMGYKPLWVEYKKI